MFDQLVEWLSKFVPEIPEEIAVCEFDCRKTQCLMGNWETCERRRDGTSHDEEKREH